MNSLEDLEKKINSELTTKINNSKIKHNQIYLETDKDDFLDVILFLKTNLDTKFRQLIDITVVDYPENNQRFQVVYLFLSHEFNQRLVLKYSISENEVIPSLTSVFPAANWMEREGPLYQFCRSLKQLNSSPINECILGSANPDPFLFKFARTIL